MGGSGDSDEGREEGSGGGEDPGGGEGPGAVETDEFSNSDDSDDFDASPVKKTTAQGHAFGPPVRKTSTAISEQMQSEPSVEKKYGPHCTVKVFGEKPKKKKAMPLITENTPEEKAAKEKEQQKRRR